MESQSEPLALVGVTAASSPTAPTSATLRPKTLIGIISAHHPSRWWYRVGARNTFLKDSPLYHIFVLGRPPVADWPYPRPVDELWADCNDEKEWMIHKTQALCQYALDHGYDFLFRCCDDTLVHVERLISAGLEAYDYAGQMPCKISLGGAFKVWFGGGFDYMHGGTGIWLSRKAMEMIVAARFDSMVCDMPKAVDVGFGLTAEGHTIWWDDLAIGEILKGRLAWDDPLRKVPLDAYSANGINVFEDEMLFFNDDPSRVISVHDPGVKKPSAKWVDDLAEKVKRRNIEVRREREKAADFVPTIEEVPHGD